ncbi:MAG: RNA polymerase sigma factor [Acidobacteriota bacterium]|nr:RNA polymerase sigma factor [Acidobacteriota bacterium]
MKGGEIETLAPQSAIQDVASVAGDLNFESIIRQHQAMVFSLAYHFLRDAAVAEELAQDVFLELHLHWKEMRSDEHVRFWLRKVASRKCIDQARRRKFRAHVALDQAPEPFAWMPAVDPMLNQYIEQLVGNLQDAPRMIVILRFQEDLEPSEIAELLEMPVATVKSHLQRSLALLRRKIEATTGLEKKHDGF